VRADIDEQQSFRSGFWMLLPGKDDATIVGSRTGVQSGKLAAQMMGLQPGIVQIFRHAPQRRLDLRLQGWIFPDQTAESPFKLWRRNEFAHGSLGRTQTGNNIFNALAFKFASAKSLGHFFCFRRRFPPPRLDATLAQKAFKHFLLIGRQRLGFGQHAI
jgi:hypothetical protein